MMIVFIDFSEVFLGMGEHGSRELYEVHSLYLSLPSMFKGGCYRLFLIFQSTIYFWVGRSSLTQFFQPVRYTLWKYSILL